MHATAAPPQSAALARAEWKANTLLVALEGDWLLGEPQPRVDDVVASIDSTRRSPERLAFDTTLLGAWDSSLLIFLVQSQEFCDARHIPVDMGGLPERVPRLLALARAVPERAQPPGAKRGNLVARLGLATLRFWDGTRASITFLGEVALAMGGVATRRVAIPWRYFWVVVQSNSSGALPIVTLIALLVGIIIAFLGVVVLKRFGAGYYVSYLAGFGMLREMGALMTGIIMAGRTGAAFAAELGSMKITEEIDAFTTLGISPIEHLVLPRILGLFVMMPLLTIYADFIGIIGGMLVSAFMLDLSFKQFLSGLLSAVTMTDALLGLVKGTVFGFIIGVSGCMRGLQAGSDASAVGRATTSAVVLGITLIISANALIDWLAAVLDI